MPGEPKEPTFESQALQDKLSRERVRHAAQGVLPVLHALERGAAIVMDISMDDKQELEKMFQAILSVSAQNHQRYTDEKFIVRNGKPERVYIPNDRTIDATALMYYEILRGLPFCQVNEASASKDSNRRRSIKSFINNARSFLDRKPGRIKSFEKSILKNFQTFLEAVITHENL